MKYLAPSVLAADFANLGDEVSLISKAGVNYIHLDVMDGMFVPNISIGAPVIKAIRPYSSCIFDVHMMVKDPERYLTDFAEAGADLITIHIEATDHPDRVLSQIHELGCKAGIAINPGTSLHVLDWLLDLADVVLLMTVNPGFGSQKIVPYSWKKIRTLHEMITSCGSRTLIEIDGGVTMDNCAGLCEAGVDILVAGSAVFHGDPVNNIRRFHTILGQFG